MSNPWVNEAWRLTALFIAALLVGWIANAITLSYLIFISSYLAWHLYRLYQLETWYRIRRKTHPPHAGGIWGEVFDHVYHLQQRDRQRKRRLASIVTRFNESTAAMPDATVILDRQGHIEWMNKAAIQNLGLNPKQDMGQRIDNLIRHPRFVDFMRQQDFDLPVEITSPVNSGQHLSVRAVSYGNDQRLMIARDITRLKHLERVRQDFVANVSHELRTPLTVINGYLENMIDANGDIMQRWGKALDQMQTQSLRMTRIVDDLLLLSRLDADELTDNFSPVAMPNIILSLKEQAQVLGGQDKHRIHTEINAKLWLMGHEKTLHSICGNLIFNAVQYTPEGGEINIRWDVDEQGATLEVRDTGIGIPQQHISRLTERFYRVDPGRSRAAGGTGLGLAIVSHGLQRHKGSLSIESEPGKGSCFRAHFPRDLVILR